MSQAARFEVPEFTEEEIERRLSLLRRDIPDATREMAIGALITSARWDHQRKVANTRVKARPEKKERSWQSIQEENWTRNKFYIRLDTEIEGITDFKPEGIEAFNSNLEKHMFSAKVYRKDTEEKFSYKKLYARSYRPTGLGKDLCKEAIKEILNDKFPMAVFYLPSDYDGEIEFTLIVDVTNPGPSRVFNVDF
jgi:hypothetical protein